MNAKICSFAEIRDVWLHQMMLAFDNEWCDSGKLVSGSTLKVVWALLFKPEQSSSFECRALTMPEPVQIVLKSALSPTFLLLETIKSKLEPTLSFCDN